MKKRIFFGMSVVVLVTVLFLAVISSLIVSSRFGTEIKENLRTMRVTIINQSGDVLFDNRKQNLENHADRPEIADAIKNGYGESERHSDTLGEKTFYYATKMPDSNILRLSVTRSGVYAWLYALVPLFLLAVILAFVASVMLARRLTKGIVEPINKIDLDNIGELPYDELAPFASKIETQKNEITAQMAVLESRADTIKAITGNMKEGLILVDKNGFVLSANKSAENIFGGIAIGKNILETSRNIEFLSGAKKALSGERAEMILEQGERTFTVFASPTVYENAVGAMLLFLDITDKRSAEKQRQEFSANVSHELKTPLTTILGLSEMIASGMAKPEDITNFANKINTQSSRLLSLIDDIIRLSEFDEGSVEKSFESFDVCELARAVCDSLAPLAEAKNITITAPIDNVIINANKRMIDEMLFNLIDNAIKYNKDGGDVSVIIKRENDNVKITVSDTGIGIDKEHQSRIFERFYRVDKSRSKRTGGTGLGLSIVKHIADFHEGVVEIISEAGKGTTVIISIRP